MLQRIDSLPDMRLPLHADIGSKRNTDHVHHVKSLILMLVNSQLSFVVLYLLPPLFSPFCCGVTLGSRRPARSSWCSPKVIGLTKAQTSIFKKTS